MVPDYNDPDSGDDSASDAEEETTELLPPNFNCDDDLLHKVFDFRKDAVNAVYIGMKTKNGTVELVRSLSISHAVIKYYTMMGILRPLLYWMDVRNIDFSTTSVYQLAQGTIMNTML